MQFAVPRSAHERYYTLSDSVASRGNHCNNNVNNNVNNNNNITEYNDDDVFIPTLSLSSSSSVGLPVSPPESYWNPNRRSTVQYAGRYRSVQAATHCPLYDNLPPCYDDAIRRNSTRPRTTLAPSSPLCAGAPELTGSSPIFPLSPISPLEGGTWSPGRRWPPISSDSYSSSVSPELSPRTPTVTQGHPRHQRSSQGSSSSSSKTSTPARLRSITANLGLIFAKRSHPHSDNDLDLHTPVDPLTRSLPLPHAGTPTVTSKMSTASLIPKKWRKSSQKASNNAAAAAAATSESAYTTKWKHQVSDTHTRTHARAY